MYQSIFAHTSSEGSSLGALWLVLLAALIVVLVVAYWRIFEKAGQAGWKSIIPIYNTYILLKIAGRPGWWLLLLFLPFINMVVSIIVAFDVAKKFGRSVSFAIFGMVLFPIIGYPMLAFGDAKYES